jgi:hypothetical protein
MMIKLIQDLKPLPLVNIRLLHLQQGNKHSDGEEYIVTSMCTWYVGSRNYKLVLNVATIGI